MRILFLAAMLSMGGGTPLAAQTGASSISAQDAELCPGKSPLQIERLQSAYRGRVILQGRAKADAWLQGECGASADQMATAAAEGASPSRSGDRSEATSKRDEKGCKMVMRPVAGLGGAAMTMAMVPDCD